MSKLYISMYHYTRDLKKSRYPRINGLDISMFRQQIEFMSRNFNIVTMEQVIEASKGMIQLPENAMLLTFDDGYSDNYCYVLPILEEYGLQGSFFITCKTFCEHKLLDVNKIHYILASGDIRHILEDLEKEMDYYRGKEYNYASNEELFAKYAIANRFDGKETIFVKRILQTILPEELRGIISSKLFQKYVGISEDKLAYELYMTEDQIRTMKRHGMFIGIHGYDHYWLGNLPLDKMKKDVDHALDVMDSFIDKKCWVMNYPYGSYNQNVADYIESKGAAIGLTTNVRIAHIGIDSPFELPRLDCNDFPPKSENYRKESIR